MTRDNTAVLFIDNQIGLFTGVRDLEVAELKHDVVGMAKAAQVPGLPIVAAIGLLIGATSLAMLGPSITVLACWSPPRRWSSPASPRPGSDARHCPPRDASAGPPGCGRKAPVIACPLMLRARCATPGSP